MGGRAVVSTIAIILALVPLGMGTISAETDPEAHPGAPGPVARAGDLVVDGQDPDPANRTFTIANCGGVQWLQRGNVSVIRGGTLVIDGCTLEFTMDSTHRFWMTVDGKNSTGKPSELRMNNAKVTVNATLIDPYLRLPFTISGGAVARIDGSTLAFPGTVEVSDATLYFNRSVTKGVISSLEPYGPALLFTNSLVVASASRFSSIPESAGGLPGVQRIPAESPGANYNSSSPFSQLQAVDLAYVELAVGQIVEIESWTAGSIVPPFRSVVLKARFQTSSNYTGPNASLQWALEGQSYKSTGITPDVTDSSDRTASFDLFAKGVHTVDEIAELDVLFTSTSVSGRVFFDSIWIEVDEKPITEVGVYGNSTLVALDTFIDIDYRPVQEVGARNFMNLAGESKFYGFGAHFDDAERAPAQGPAVVTTGAKAAGYLFRWANVTVRDVEGTTVGGASVVLEPNYTDPGKSQARAWNDLCDANHTVGSLVIEHVSRLYRATSCPTAYNTTVTDGRVVLAALSNVITGDQLPNSWYGGKYHVIASTAQGNCTGYLGTQTYPKTTQASNYYQIVSSCPYSTAGADLVIDLSAMPPKGPVGFPIDIPVTIMNSGQADSSSTNSRVFIDENNNGKFDAGVDILICSRTVPPLVKSGGKHPFTCSWTPVATGPTRITGTVDKVANEPMSKAGNNIAIRPFSVLGLPDLQPFGFRILDEGGQEVEKHLPDARVQLTLRVVNGGESDSGNFTVRFSYNGSGGPLIGIQNVSGIAGGDDHLVMIEWDLPLADGDPRICVEADSEAVVVEQDESNNLGCASTRVRQAPDVAVLQVVVLPAKPEERAKAEIRVTIQNVGEWDVSNVRLNVTDNRTGKVNESAVGLWRAGAAKVLKFPWSIPIGQSGPHSVCASLATEAMTPAERLSATANNSICVNFTVSRLPVQISLLGEVWPKPTGAEFLLTPNLQVYIEGTVTKKGTNNSLGGLKVKMEVSRGGVTLKSLEGNTSAQGVFFINIPLDGLGEGSYDYTLEVAGYPESKISGTLKLVTPVQSLPLMWIIVAIVAAAIGGVFGVLFLFRRTAKNLAECSECSALVPYDAVKCLKCGTAFEMEQVKCSSCLSWIPSSATQCPQCGVTFSKSKVPQTAQDVQVSEEYDALVEAKRDEYRKVAGKTFTEARFQSWWKRQKMFVTLEAYKAEKSGPQAPDTATEEVKCDSCGTGNPADAQACSNCGTPLVAGPPPIPGDEIEEAKPVGAAKPSVAPVKEKRRVLRAPETKGSPVKPQVATPASSSKKDSDLGPRPPGAKAVTPRQDAGEAMAGPTLEVAVEVPRLCFSCFAKNKMDAVKCEGCGADLPPLKKCGTCNEMVPQDMTFCFKCGSPM